MPLRANLTDQWEGLYFTYLAIALVVGAAVLGWLFWSMWRYRWRPDAPRPPDAPTPGVIPAERGHVLWVYVMAGGIAAIMFSLAFSTISAIDVIENPPEGEPAIHVDVTGFQFGWRFTYVGAGGIPLPQTSPANAFTVPVGTNVVMNVTSQDVWHNFAIPDYRIRIDAIPGEVNHLWFRAETLGTGHTVCVQLCGSGHAFMRADLKVVPQQEYDAWFAQASAAEYAKLLKRNTTAEVNVTWTGGDPGVAPTHAPAGKAVVLNVTNQASGPVHLALTQGDRVLGAATVPAGGQAYFYLNSKEPGTFALRSGTAQLAIEVS